MALEKQFILPPLKGLNLYDNPFTMSPEYATILENFLPPTTTFTVRPAVEYIATLPGHVKGMFGYATGATIDYGSDWYLSNIKYGSANTLLFKILGTSGLCGLYSLEYGSKALKLLGNMPNGVYNDDSALYRHTLFMTSGARHSAMYLYHQSKGLKEFVLRIGDVGHINIGDLSNITIFKNYIFLSSSTELNVFFIESKKADILDPLNDAWYQQLGNVFSPRWGGNFSLDGAIQNGGTILKMFSISRSGQDSVNSYLAVLTTQGEIVLFDGTDPSDTKGEKWKVVGHFHIPPPLNKYALIDMAGDFIVATKNGLVSLRRVMFGDSSAITENLEYRLMSLFSQYMFKIPTFSEYISLYYHPKNRLLIFNIPTSMPYPFGELQIGSVIDGEHALLFMQKHGDGLVQGQIRPEALEYLKTFVLKYCLDYKVDFSYIVEFNNYFWANALVFEVKTGTDIDPETRKERAYTTVDLYFKRKTSSGSNVVTSLLAEPIVVICPDMWAVTKTVSFEKSIYYWNTDFKKFVEAENRFAYIFRTTDIGDTNGYAVTNMFSRVARFIDFQPVATINTIGLQELNSYVACEIMPQFYNMYKVKGGEQQLLLDSLFKSEEFGYYRQEMRRDQRISPFMANLNGNGTELYSPLRHVFSQAQNHLKGLSGAVNKKGEIRIHIPLDVYSTAGQKRLNYTLVWIFYMVESAAVHFEIVYGFVIYQDYDPAARTGTLVAGYPETAAITNQLHTWGTLQPDALTIKVEDFGLPNQAPFSDLPKSFAIQETDSLYLPQTLNETNVRAFDTGTTPFNDVFKDLQADLKEGGRIHVNRDAYDYLFSNFVLIKRVQGDIDPFPIPPEPTPPPVPPTPDPQPDPEPQPSYDGSMVSLSQYGEDMEAIANVTSFKVTRKLYDPFHDWSEKYFNMTIEDAVKTVEFGNFSGISLKIENVNEETCAKWFSGELPLPILTNVLGTTMPSPLRVGLMAIIPNYAFASSQPAPFEFSLTLALDNVIYLKKDGEEDQRVELNGSIVFYGNGQTVNQTDLELTMTAVLITGAEGKNIANFPYKKALETNYDVKVLFAKVADSYDVTVEMSVRDQSSDGDYEILLDGRNATLRGEGDIDVHYGSQTPVAFGDEWERWVRRQMPIKQGDTKNLWTSTFGYLFSNMLLARTIPKTKTADPSERSLLPILPATNLYYTNYDFGRVPLVSEIELLADFKSTQYVFDSHFGTWSSFTGINMMRGKEHMNDFFFTVPEGVTFDSEGNFKPLRTALCRFNPDKLGDDDVRWGQIIRPIQTRLETAPTFDLGKPVKKIFKRIKLFGTRSAFYQSRIYDSQDAFTIIPVSDFKDGQTIKFPHTFDAGQNLTSIVLRKYFGTKARSYKELSLSDQTEFWKLYAAEATSLMSVSLPIIAQVGVRIGIKVSSDNVEPYGQLLGFEIFYEATTQML